MISPASRGSGEGGSLSVLGTQLAGHGRESAVAEGRPAAIADDSLDGAQLYALRELARDETLSQRDLAGRLGLSLGRVNYVVNSLIRKGLVKARRFKNARNKLAYRYVLTPAGLREKVIVTRRFLEARIREYERLQREIEVLRREAAAEDGEGGSG